MDVGDGWMDVGDGCGGLMDGWKKRGLWVDVCVQRSWRRVGEKGFGWGGGGGGERMLGGYLSYCHTMRIRVYQKKKKKDKSGNSTL